MLPVIAMALAKDASTGVADPALAALLDEHWEAWLANSPVQATQLGDHRFDDRLDDNNPKAIEAWGRLEEGWLERARALRPSSAADRLTTELFVERLETSRAVDACRSWSWSISARDNELVYAGWLVEAHPLPDPAAGRALLARYRALSGHIEQALHNLRLGAREGLHPNAASVRIVAEQVEAELGRPLEQWSLLRVLAAPELEAWPEAERRAFARELREVVQDDVRPALLRYGRFLRAEVLPGARPDGREGLGALPGGDRCYAALVRQHTTLSRDPAEIHADGLAALASIHAEMRALGPRLFGTDDLGAIFRRLREDPALHFRDEAEVEGTAAAALARAKAALPRAFRVLPRADCVVARIPPQEAPWTTIAYYWPAVPGGEKPGQYFVNTWAPTTRPRYEAEALAWHEAIPGHHLQIALAQELEAVPAFRRHAYLTAYAEGWALYAERLADEMGLYSGDLDRMGMYGFDAWRASRLVVDTGLHAMGWSREQAVQFMLANTTLAENNIRNEVDRYLTDPGQALAYKTGQLEILRLRREAEARLGPRFDLPAFHELVLGAGPVTLPQLARRVEAWQGE